MAKRNIEVDTTFYETLPPQMIDLRHLPPMQSDALEIGRSRVECDEVLDPLYPVETMEHDTDEGYKRWVALKEKKQNEVQGYLIVRNKFWEQIRTWQYFADTQTETWKYFSGASESHATDVTTSIEGELGLSKGIFSAKLKAGLKFSQQDTKTFSQSVEHTINLSYEANCYYLFWQIVENFDLFRIRKTTPAEPQYVKSYSGYSETQMTNKFRASELARPGEHAAPPLRAAAKVLDRGESYSVGTYLIGKTKFSFKNLSNQEKSEVTLVPMIGGLWSRPWVISINPGYTKSVHHAYTADQVRITNSGAHRIEVWSG